MPRDLARITMSELAAAGADVVFGVPGGGPNLEKVGAGIEAGMRFVLVHGETAGCITAATYGKLTGAPGVALVTRGPGATSAVNGVAQATLDRYPLVLLSDVVPSDQRRRVPHQRVAQTAVMAPVSKWSGTLGHADPSGVVRSAAALALAAPAGAVHLDFDATARGDQPPAAAEPPPMNPERLDAARALIDKAERPLLLVGAEAIPWTDAVRDLAARLGAPALVSYQAKGVVPDESPHYGGLFTNGASERPLLEQADLLLAIGLDPVEPIPRPWTHPAPVVALNPWPIVDPYYPMTVEITSPIEAAIAELGEMQPGTWQPGAGAEANAATLAALAADAPGFTPFDLVHILRDAAPQDAVVTVDAGAHFLVIMPHWSVSQPLDLLISNGLATMGFAVPAAIGAALARPERPVLCLVGDGGLGMTLAELETIARLDLDITVVVFNDSGLSLIEIKQEAHHGGDSAVRYRATDFAAAARAMGLDAHTARDAHEVRAALAAGRGPRLIDVSVDPSVYTHVLAVTRG